MIGIVFSTEFTIFMAYFLAILLDSRFRLRSLSVGMRLQFWLLTATYTVKCIKNLTIEISRNLAELYRQKRSQSRLGEKGAVSSRSPFRQMGSSDDKKLLSIWTFLPTRMRDISLLAKAFSSNTSDRPLPLHG